MHIQKEQEEERKTLNGNNCVNGPTVITRNRTTEVLKEHLLGLAYCWKITLQDSFFLLFDTKKELTFIGCAQCNRKKIPGLKTVLAQWYQIEYARYKNSSKNQQKSPHVLIQKIVVDLSINSNTMFKVAALWKSNLGCFESEIGNIKITQCFRQVDQLQGCLLFIWCRLDYHADGSYQFVFARDESEPEKLKSSIPVDNFEIATEADEDAFYEDKASGLCIGNNVAMATNNYSNGDQNFVKEVPVLQHLLEPLMNKLNYYDFTTSKCQWEPPEEGSNAIQIVGTDLQQVKEGVDIVKELRKQLLVEYENKNQENNSNRVADVLTSTNYGHQEQDLQLEEQCQPNSTNNSSKDAKEVIYTKILQIPRRFYPWIRGPYQHQLKLVEQEQGVKINLPEHPRNDVVLTCRESDILEEFAKKFNKMLDQRKRMLTEKKCRIPRSKHSTILLDTILEQTDASVELPRADDQEQDVVLIRGTVEANERAVAVLQKQFGTDFVEEIEIKRQISQVSELEKRLQKWTMNGPQTKLPSASAVTAANTELVIIQKQKQQPTTSSNCIKSNSTTELPKLEQLRTSSLSSLKQPPVKQSIRQHKQRDQSLVATRKPSPPLLTSKAPPEEIVLNVPKEYYGNIIGKEGKNKKRMETAYAVKIVVPAEFSKSEKIRIQGLDEEKMRKCCDEIKKLVDRMQNEYIEQVHVQCRLIPLIVGTGGKNIKKLRAKYPHADVDIPWENAANNGLEEGELVEDDCAITLHGCRDEVNSLASELNNNIAQLQLAYHQEVFALPADDPNHTPVEYIKFLCGTNCSKIRALNQEYPDVAINFPLPNNVKNEQQERIVKLDGPKNRVNLVKQILLAQIEELKKQKVQIVPIAEEKFIAKFLHSNGQLLNEITEENNCFIHLDRKKQHFVIRGQLEHVTAAKQAIEDILAQMVEIVREVQIPSRHHDLLRIRIIQIRQKFNVKVTFPPMRKASDLIRLVGRSEETLDAAARELFDQCPVIEQMDVPKEYRSKLMQNGAEYLKQLEATHKVKIRSPLLQQPFVIVTGPKLGVQQCLAAIRSELPVSENILVPTEFYGAFIGPGGENIKQMEKKHSVRIHSATNPLGTTTTVVGNVGDVHACIAEIESFITNQECEKQKKLSKSHQQCIYVPKELHSRLIGTGGSIVNELSKRHKVKISFGGLSENEATLTGHKEDCERCEQEIKDKMEQFYLLINNKNSKAGTTAKPLVLFTPSSSTFKLSVTTTTAQIRNPLAPAAFNVSTTAIAAGCSLSLGGGPTVAAGAKRDNNDRKRPFPSSTSASSPNSNPNCSLM